MQITIFQWVQPWYGAGKTSDKTASTNLLYIPGTVAWITMEVWGMISLLYMLYTIPSQNGINGIGSLPWENKAMAGMFVRLLLKYMRSRSY